MQNYCFLILNVLILLHQKDKTMKIKISISRLPNGKNEKLDNSIFLKTYDKIIEIPYTPKAEYNINLSSFCDVYGFTKEEQDYIDGYGPIFEIDYIVMYCDCLELCIKD